MKTTLLFSAAILVSVVTFAQTSVKNQETVKSITAVQSDKGSSEVKSSGSASSSTNIQSNAANSTEHKAYSTAEKGKNEIAAEKQALATKAKTEAQQAKKTASQDVTVSANAQSDTKITATEKNNKTQENASFNAGTHVSSKGIKNSSNHMMKESEATVGNSAVSAIETGNGVKTGVSKATVKTGETTNAASATTIKSRSSTAHSVKPAPASLKMNTHVKTNSGIRIK